MGQVAVVLKITPEEMEGFEKLKSEIAAIMKPYKIEDEPLAFGIVAVKATFIIEDGIGGDSALEEKALTIPNVSGVETLSCDRI